MKYTSNPDTITRDYFDSLLLETRYIDSVLPTTKMNLFGEEFDTPIMTAALSHLNNSTSPDEYARLIEDVNRTEFGTHLDVVNMITSPQRYFFNAEFLHECFEKLKGTICSCHLKDVRLKEEYTFQLEECACGQGALDIELYARLADAENPDMPMIIEHLTTDEEYAESVRYVRGRLNL